MQMLPSTEVQLSSGVDGPPDQVAAAVQHHGFEGTFPQLAVDDGGFDAIEIQQSERSGTWACQWGRQLSAGTLGGR